MPVSDERVVDRHGNPVIDLDEARRNLAEEKGLIVDVDPQTGKPMGLYKGRRDGCFLGVIKSIFKRKEL